MARNLTCSAKFKTALGSTLVLLTMLVSVGSASAVVPTGFKDEAALKGLNQPTIVKFAPDGRIFVAEKGGKILVFENLQDETPEVFANLSKPVYDYEDHGLLGLTIDPMFDLGRPFVYAIYTFNHELATKGTQTPQVEDPKAVTPRWPSKGPGFENDMCPNGEEAKEKHIKEDPGCEVSGVVVRLEAEAGTEHAVPSAAEPEEKVLLEGWCQQATTHSIGDVGFGPEGNLFVTGGEGAMYSEPDYGQYGNPCEDPVQTTGTPEEIRLTAEGGSLRSQSLLRTHDVTHPTLLSGSVLRVDPNTGEGVAGNPYASSTEANARRIIAIGFRQPWRFAFNPRTSHLFVDNVGNGHFEEMDRIPLDGSADYADAGIPYARGGSAYNGGWPCYEGGPAGPERNYEYAGEYEEGGERFKDPSIQVCINQYKAEDEGKPQTSAPFFSYAHSGPIAPEDPCDPTKTPTDIGGISFYEGTNYPKSYANALFFSDPIRGCIYVMKAGPDGEPIPSTVTTFASGKSPFSFPAIDMEQGTGGDIFYTEFGHGATGGTVQRITFSKEAKEAEEREEREAREAVERAAREQAEREARERTAKPVIPQPPPPAPTYSPPKLHGKPQKSTAKTTAKFSFGAASGLRFRCKIDGKKFGGCKSPRTYKHLEAGKHSFRVYAIDSSGARATANTQFNWKVVGGGR